MCGAVGTNRCSYFLVHQKEKVINQQNAMTIVK